MNGAYEDPMMGAPSEPTPEQLRDLHLKVVMPVAKGQDKEKKTA
jgi:aspartyl-tRNA synthetase